MTATCEQGLSEHICKYCLRKEQHPDGFCICQDCGARIKVGWRKDERDARIDVLEDIVGQQSRIIVFLVGRYNQARRRMLVKSDYDDKMIDELIETIKKTPMVTS